jgi:V/A-type H+-transporting ATPase subunit G/H
LESSDRVLKDLAAREQALSSRVAAAREEAARILAEADAKARAVLLDAEAKARALTDEYHARQAAEESAIREQALQAANAAASQSRSNAEGRIPQAVRLIVERVLP